MLKKGKEKKNGLVEVSLLHILFLHLLRQLCIMLLEALANALLRGHPLEDTAVQAAGFLGGERLGGEVVDAGGEAVLGKASESGDEFLDLTLLHALLEGALLGGR